MKMKSYTFAALYAKTNKKNMAYMFNWKLEK